MADTNPKVLAMVERALKKNPDLASTELHERAKKIDKSVEDLTGRQFHARYALQVRKRLAGKSGGRKKKKSGGKRRKATAKKGGRRKAGRRASTRGVPRTGPAIDMLSESYEQQKTALNKALDDAFAAAVRDDSVKQINQLLRDVQKTTEKYA